MRKQGPHKRAQPFGSSANIDSYGRRLVACLTLHWMKAPVEIA